MIFMIFRVHRASDIETCLVRIADETSLLPADAVLITCVSE